MSNKNKNPSDIQITKMLFKDVAALIEQSRSYVALTINREITVLNYNVGKAISNCLLKIKGQVMAKLLMQIYLSN